MRFISRAYRDIELHHKRHSRESSDRRISWKKLAGSLPAIVSRPSEIGRPRERGGSFSLQKGWRRFTGDHGHYWRMYTCVRCRKTGQHEIDRERDATRGSVDFPEFASRRSRVQARVGSHDAVHCQ